MASRNDQKKPKQSPFLFTLKQTTSVQRVQYGDYFLNRDSSFGIKITKANYTIQDSAEKHR